MSAVIDELAILDGDSCIFTRGDRYEIPLYQRPYAWTEHNIEQLIDDVRDIPADGSQKYYLGSLVVAHKPGKPYEVIDGQQRLTTLYLLLFALGVDLAKEGELALSFSCRDNSDYTLKNLAGLDGAFKLEEKRIEYNIKNGLDAIQQKLASEFSPEDLLELKAKLERTCLYRIEVPPHTDLNHYFEIMNTRGEQLEQHEVLKARLMEPLHGQEAVRFAAIWDACSDMACYVQTRFEVPVRETLFGWWFDQFPSDKSIDGAAWGEDAGSDSLGIREIVSDERAERRGRGDDEYGPSRFESVIDFRFFLLHALKVFVRTRGIVGADPDEKLVAGLIDDKKLGEAFDRVIKHGRYDGRPFDGAWFSNEFIKCLLQTRFLFDKCIAKREYVGGDTEGKWSLKELHRGSKSSHYYRNTAFRRKKGQWASTLDQTNRIVLMLESCLRVSYTSPKVMHWITELLTRLMDDVELAGSERFVRVVEDRARDAVRGFVEAGEYSLGVNTPHVVLNYLDYLLWWRGGCSDDFTFEFRTSVEHWYPQNPSDDTFVRWSEVDRFGNLCLLQRSTNSKFSNLNPVAKQSTYQEMIAKGSLKLREMSRLTNGVDGWINGACQRHEEEMLALLREACGMNEGETA